MIGHPRNFGCAIPSVRENPVSSKSGRRSFGHIAGLVGGGVLGQIVTFVWPAVSASLQGGNLDVGSIVTQVVGGGAGGAILTAIVGSIKNKAS